jgi:hypothetical protein
MPTAVLEAPIEPFDVLVPIDFMVNQQSLCLLRSMRCWLSDHKNWSKHSWVVFSRVIMPSEVSTFADVSRACLAGACDIATQIAKYSYVVKMRALTELAYTINYNNTQRSARDIIICFNDSAFTEHSDMLAALDRTISRLEAYSD